MAPPTKMIGELAVVALKAKDLPNREIVGKQDPFCVFRLGEEAKKTKTDYRGGQHPVWDDQVNLMVPEGKVKMRVQLYDEDAKREDLISETDIDISTVIKDGEEDGWFPLMYKGRKAGEIYLELTFYAARPLPRRQPTRYKNLRPHSYQAPPPVPSPNYPPSTGRPLPVAPTASNSTPSRFGPPPYIPPQVAQPPQNVATPHMPTSLTPSTSNGYSHQYAQHYEPQHQPAHYPPPPSHQQQQQQQHLHHQQQHQQHQPQLQPQPVHNGAYYPPGPPATSPAPSGTQPLLSAPFRPGHSPQNSASGNQGYAPPQPYSHQGPPAQFGNDFSTPVMASTNPVSFPQPQRNPGYQHPPGGNAPPFSAAQYPNPSVYPNNPSSYPPNYPPSYPPQH